jgi:uncharacterized membrane protein
MERAGVSKQHRWLKNEVARWRADGVVDDATAQRILARYPDAPERGWARTILSTIGAVLVGLGVILFFAYNWQAIPKAFKLLLVFGALVTAHGAAMRLAHRPEANRALVEGLHALGTMLFGAGIWLVAQIYHIDEHYPNAFLVWSLGALALAWAMPSIVQALLALFLVAFWAGIEVFQFRTPMHGAPLLVAAGVLPLAWWRRSPALLGSALAVLFLVTALAVVWVELDALLPLLFMMGTAALLAAVAAPSSLLPEAEGPLRTIGMLVVLGCGFALTFPGLASGIGRVNFDKPGIAIYFGAVGAALLGAVAAVAWARQQWSRLDTLRRWQLALIGIGLAIVLVCTFSHARVGGWAIALPFNLIVLGLAALLIVEGSAQLQPRKVGAGCVLFALVTVGRYADLFDSQLVRASVFVLLGAGLFFVGSFYARSRRRAQELQS